MSPVLALHDALVRFPSLSTHERAIADFVEAHARAAGLDVGRHEDNVWAALGQGDDLLLLASHLDVVPPSAAHPYDPFTPTTVDGRIYARGAVDAKASGAAMLQALIDLHAGGFRPDGGRLMVALTACEETGGPYNGLDALRPHLPPVAAALIGEPTGLRPCLAQKGLLLLTATAHGRTAHAARAHLGQNALTAMARDLLRLDAFAFERADPLLGAPTVTATVIAGGAAKNVVPDTCTVTLDVRSTPAYTHDELTRVLADALESTVEVYSARLVPCSTPEDARIATATRASLRALGLDDTPFGSPTASDWVFVNDVPAVKLGPGRSELSHTPDEHVEAAEVERAVAVYASTATAYFA